MGSLAPGSSMFQESFVDLLNRHFLFSHKIKPAMETRLGGEKSESARTRRTSLLDEEQQTHINASRSFLVHVTQVRRFQNKSVDPFNWMLMQDVQDYLNNLSKYTETVS